MGFNAKDAVDAVRDIATNAVEKASDIVENAGDIIRGDIAARQRHRPEFNGHRHSCRGENERSLHRRRQVRSRGRLVAVRRWRRR